MREQETGWNPNPKTPSHITFHTVPGYFLQDDPSTDDHAFDYVWHALYSLQLVPS
jgi:hypothetical protein